MMMHTVYCILYTVYCTLHTYCICCIPCFQGKPVGLATNCSKHILAELKADHYKRTSLTSSLETNSEPILGAPPWQGWCDADDMTNMVRQSLPELHCLPPPETEAQQVVPSALSQGRQLQLIEEHLKVSAQRGYQRKRSRSVQDQIEEIVKPAQHIANPDKSRRLNGWTLHLANTWRECFRRPGETKRERRQRVLELARATWQARCGTKSLKYEVRSKL